MISFFVLLMRFMDEDKPDNQPDWFDVVAKRFQFDHASTRILCAYTLLVDLIFAVKECRVLAVSWRCSAGTEAKMLRYN